MNSSTTKLTLAIMLGAIGSLVMAGVGVASVNADINNPGQVRIDDSKVIINIGAGKDGEQGPQGEKGDKGDTGDQGPPGPAGNDGANGTDGKDGVNGTNGVDGQNGRDGVNGTNGVDGKDGQNATATVLINSTNGQQTQCTVSPPSTVNCVEVNGTIPIPPVVCTPPEVNVNGTCTIEIPPVDNNTGGNDTNGNNTNGNGTIPAGYDIPTGLAKILGL